MKKIKYCALTTISSSLRQFVMPAAEYLSQHGYEVTVGCAEDREFAASLPETIRYLPIDIERGYSLKKTVKAFFQLYRFFKQEKIEMVEYGTENVAFCASAAAWMARVPVRIYNHWGARYIGYAGIQRAVSLTIERMAAFFSTDIRQQSQKNKELCVKDRVYPEKKVSVIGYGGTVGADFSRFDIQKKTDYRYEVRGRYQIPADDFVFGDVGYIRKDKGTNELLTAFFDMQAPDVWLMLVGDVFEPDAPDSDLMKRAQEHPRVIFTGRVSDVERYVSAFDCLVHPSYREGLGMVLQEAGAMGVPYITTDIPGPSEFGIDGETGLLVQKGNAQDLQRKMELLVKDPRETEELSVRVYALTKERYERQRMLRRIYEDREALKERLSR